MDTRNNCPRGKVPYGRRTEVNIHVHFQFAAVVVVVVTDVAVTYVWLEIVTISLQGPCSKTC